jgi:TonB family protein
LNQEAPSETMKGMGHNVEKNRTSNLARRLIVFLGLLLVSCMVFPQAVQQQQEPEPARKLKSSVPPEYPELARRLQLKGTARVSVTVAPDGRVTNAKELGGNPVLVDALLRAVKKWKYEPAAKESVVEVKFEFAP